MLEKLRTRPHAVAGSRCAPRTVLFQVLVLVGCITAATAEPTNILFIAIDDLNDWTGTYGGHPQAETPNMDRLAAQGLQFSNAHCQAPICGPSRNSLLTGILPSTSGLYFLKPLSIRDTATLKAAVTLPQYFLTHGYRTLAAGKVFHQNDEASFPEYGGGFGRLGPYPKKRISFQRGSKNVDWGRVPFLDDEMPDSKIADWAIEQLEKPHDRPFFLGCGFFRPHWPWYVGDKWFEPFPLEDIQIPETLAGTGANVSDYARKLTYSAAAPRHRWMVESDEWQHAVQAYLASVRFVDHCVGRVLEALKNSDHADNTLIVLWSDHGYHLGEKQRWAKRSLWEESTRVPLILAGPGIPGGAVCERPVGLIDLYPTLVDYARLPRKPHLDGVSLMPLIQNPSAPWKRPTITTFGPHNHAIRSERWRYIHYADGSEELYDHRTDPNERFNLASELRFRDVIRKHRNWLPQVNAPLAEGSADSGSPLYDPKVIYQPN